MADAARKITLGADPEIPVGVLDENNSLISWKPACGLFGGTKGAPISQGDVGGWLEDGVMLELNPNPASNPEVLADNIKDLLNKASKHVKKVNPKLTLVVGSASAHYREDELNAHPEARVFGCAVDYDAYSPGLARSGIMERAMEEFGEGIRFAGGHIHIGIDPWPEELPKFVAIKFLDLLLQMPFVRRNGYSRDRHQYYGKMGIFRETSYGVEYRTPDPNWILTEDVNRSSFNVSTQYLQRAYEVALLFAHFETYRDRMIEVYNSMNWNRLHETIAAFDRKGMLTALTESGIAEEHSDGLNDNVLIKFADNVAFNAADYRYNSSFPDNMLPWKTAKAAKAKTSPTSGKKPMYYTAASTSVAMGGIEVAEQVRRQQELIARMERDAIPRREALGELAEPRIRPVRVPVQDLPPPQNADVLIWDEGRDLNAGNWEVVDAPADPQIQENEEQNG